MTIFKVSSQLINLPKQWLLIGSAAVLTACGGGGDGAGGASPSPVVTGNPPNSESAPASAPSSAPSPPPPSPPSANSAALTAENTCSIPNFKADMLRAINEARATARNCGSTAKSAVPAVGWNDKLFVASASHSNDMVQRNYFNHDNPDGVSPGQRVTAAGYQFGITGENIAAGQVGIASVMSAWLGSPGHCSSIMEERFVDVAVACVTTTQARYRTYWTMELAAPQ